MSQTSEAGRRLRSGLGAAAPSRSQTPSPTVEDVALRIEEEGQIAELLVERGAAQGLGLAAVVARSQAWGSRERCRRGPGAGHRRGA